MRLDMRFIGWWTRCSLMQHNPESESHLLIPWLWKISWGIGQLSSLARPPWTRQMHGWGSVRRYVKRSGALMHRSWPLSHSFLWQTLSTGEWGCNSWCRLVKSRWLGLISGHNSWRNTFLTTPDMRGKQNLLLCSRGLWRCRPILKSFRVLGEVLLAGCHRRMAL